MTSPDEAQGGRLPEEVTVEEVEDLLCDLSAVDGCSVVCNEWGAIEEIHILATDQRHPKQIVRDVESALAARWGLEVNHRKISVAQTVSGSAGGREESPEASFSFELVSLSLESSLTEAEVRARVTLRNLYGEEATASARGTVSPVQNIKIPAQAAVAALNDILDGPRVNLEDVRGVDLSGGETVICQLGAVSKRGGMEMTAGASMVDNEDWAHAAVGSVLLAVRELMGKLRAKQTV